MMAINLTVLDQKKAWEGVYHMYLSECDLLCILPDL